MKNDLNPEESAKRKRRFKNIPAPSQLNLRGVHDSEWESFEDAALDSTLEAMGTSKSDGVEFLERVRSKIESPAPKKLVEHEQAKAFFGFGSSLLGEDSVSAAENSKSSSRGRLVKLILSTAAVLACLVVGGFSFLVDDSNDRASAENLATTVEDDVAVDPKAASTNMVGQNEDRDARAELVESNSPVINVVEEVSAVPVEPLEIADNAVGLEASIEKERLPTGPPKGSLWNLKFDFDKQWDGTVGINGHELESKITKRTADVVLKKIGHQVARRAHFLGPTLKGEWVGEIWIEGPDFVFRKHFEGVDAMFETVLDARSKLEVRCREKKDESKVVLNQFWLTNAFRELSQETGEIQGRAEMPAAVSEAVELTMADIRSHMTAIIFRKRASVRYKHYPQVSVNQFGQYQLGGKLEIPESLGEVFIDETQFQSVEPDALVAQLAKATKYDLFQNDREFDDWLVQVGAQSKSGFLANAHRQLLKQIEELRDRMNRLPSGSSEYRTVQEELNVRGAQARRLRTQILKVTDPTKQVEPLEPLLALMPSRPELKGFALAMGDACHLDNEDAKTLSFVSRFVGQMLQGLGSFGSRDVSKLTGPKRAFIRKLIRKIVEAPGAGQAIRTIDQMLQVESPEIRLELIDALGQMGNDVSCDLLACYAKFDVDPGIRAAATDALRTFPPAMSRAELITGFQYPWPEVAKHTAEALVRLNDTEAVPELVKFLALNDPRLPVKLDDDVFRQREMVAVNHNKNCLLCHSDSQSTQDPGRAAIPIWGEQLPQVYYAGRNSSPMVRADVTYLRQDFSVIQKVKDHGPWPEKQRFDYLVRDKIVGSDEALKVARQIGKQPNEYKAAIVKALKVLTNKRPTEDTYEGWRLALGLADETIPQ